MPEGAAGKRRGEDGEAAGRFAGEVKRTFGLVHGWCMKGGGRSKSEGRWGRVFCYRAGSGGESAEKVVLRAISGGGEKVVLGKDTVVQNGCKGRAGTLQGGCAGQAG